MYFIPVRITLFYCLIVKIKCLSFFVVFFSRGILLRDIEDVILSSKGY